MNTMNTTLTTLTTLALVALSGCLDGGDDAGRDRDRDDDDDGFFFGEGEGEGDTGDARGEVTRCLGPSCPLGECGFDNDCSAYDDFDPEDGAELCSAPEGAREFCLEFEVPTEDGFVESISVVVSCASPTVVQRTCAAGCGYNYAPDDCAKCAESDDCAFD